MVVPGHGGPQLDPTAPPPSAVRRSAAADTVAVTFRHLDRDGQLAPGARTAIANLDGSVNQSVPVGTGEVTLELPEGRYVLVSVLAGPQDQTVLVQPLLTVATDTTVVLDARRAEPVALTVDDPSLRSHFSAVYFARRMDDGSMIGFSTPGGPVDRLLLGQIGPDVADAELTASVSSHWAVPGPSGDFANSPITYTTLDTVRGRFLTDFRRHVRRDALARLDSTIRSTGPGLVGSKGIHIVPPDLHQAWGIGVPRTRPGRVAEYVEAAAEVGATFQERTAPDQTDQLVTSLNWSTTRTFAAGRAYPVDWNRSVLGPHVSAGSAARYGNLLSIEVGMYDDAAGHAAWGIDDSASTRLLRDGEVIVENDRAGTIGRGVEVAPGAATYRLESTVDRPDATRRSTRISAAWTFRSEQAAAAGEALPLWSVRFQPKVGLTNAVDAGPVTTLPFTVTPQPGAKVGALTRLVVEISGDGGKSWRRTAVVARGDGRFVAVAPTPPGASTIAVRATATDSAGNSLEQTILDAYGQH